MKASIHLLNIRISRKEAGRLMGLSREMVRIYIRDGKIKQYRWEDEKSSYLLLNEILDYITFKNLSKDERITAKAGS